MKTEDILERTCVIITRIGTTHTTYECGLPQGSPLSCIIANLVILMKHKAMRIDPDNPSAEIDAYRNKNGYTYQIVDPEDIKLTIASEGYSDDNLRYTQAPTTTELIHIAKTYARYSGDISLVTKIGRKGSKSGITLYNYPPEKVEQLHNFTSVAWSFNSDSVEK